MSREIRHSSEKLANILNHPPFPGQADELKRFLSECSSNGFSLVGLINYQIPRYHGRTVVHISANNGLFECLEELLRLGGEPNATSFPPDLCQTPLHLAATKGNARCLQVLLENKADMFLENSHRVKAVELVSGKKVCEKVFQHAVAKITIPARTREQQQRVVDMHQYVEDGEELHKFYQMYENLPPGHMDLATRWNDLSQTLMYRACSRQRLEVVQCLLSRSTSEPLPNLSGNESPIHITCERGNHKIARALLDHSTKLIFAMQTENKTPLHIACSKGDLEMVKVICDRIRSYVTAPDFKDVDSLPPNMKDKLGRTPFFIACYYGHFDIVREFCQLKEDLGKDMTLDVNSAVFETNRTPLHAAVCKGSLDTVSLLLSLEDTNKNVKARPSQATQDAFLHLIELKRHGRMLSQDESMIVEEGPRLRSPTGTPIHRPPPILHYGTMSGRQDHGGGMHATTNSGFTAQTREETETTTQTSAYATATSPPWLSNFTMPVVPHKLSPNTPHKSTLSLEPQSPQSDIDGVLPAGGGTRALGIFLNHREELVVGKREQTGGKNFNQLMLTPLAEACALGHNEIAEALLSYGGFDSSGVACRITHLAQSYDLMQYILAHCCSVIKEKTDLGTSTVFEQTLTAPGLQLAWGSQKLPEVRGEWFTDSATYYVDKPPSSEGDGDDETDSVKLEGYRNLRRIEPLQRSQLTLKEMPIRELNLSKNNLKSLPLEVFQLEHLADLWLQNNRIVELPEAKDGKNWKCNRLERLNLSHNNLLRLPACLWMLPNLKRFCASYNNITSFSADDIPEGELSSVLTSIDLSHNHIYPELPPFLFEFPSLKKAFFSTNKLIRLPSTIWTCPTLKELTVSHNELTELPLCEPVVEPAPTEAAPGGYTILHQSDQVLTGVVQVKPTTSSNPYKQKSSLYRSIKPTGIQELSWVNYSVVNTESYDYSELTKLDVSHNKLTAFPEALPCLAPNLTELYISRNQIHFIDIQYVPQSIKKLYCRNCEVELVGNVIDPEQFKQAVRSCRCPLENFEGKPCQHRNHVRLSHLTSFNLGHNRIKHFQLIHRRPYDHHAGDPGNHPLEKAFQASLSSLDLLYPALENLDLSENNLHGLFNPNIGHQTHLKSIKLHSNPELERIPFQFSCLKKSKDFTELTMSNLPKLYEPPVEYQKADLSHVLSYMRSCLKDSVPHRSIKLFFIGSGERGKTTLLRRLRGLPEEKTSRTEGIDIEDWRYAPSPGKLKFSSSKPQVHFLAWDFAGQNVYQTTHQCFYSRRSLYLALFRLTDGRKGVEELEPWLRNVKLRAPGSVVVIVGTHMDLIKDQYEMKELERLALTMYGGTSREHTLKYPKVVHVTSVSSKQKFFSHNNIDKLRMKLYDIACHLQLSSDGVTLEYKEGCKEDDPKCLFQQQIPKNFLQLQEEIREVVAGYRVSGRIPILEEGEFSVLFKHLFDDEEEMNEAVFFLNLQGTILHFEDHGLKETYFLDPQWLAKLMASIIQPAAEEGKSPIKKGMGEICNLFKDSPDRLRKKYIQLLEKFEVALQLTDTQVIIPSLMPDEVNYPKPNDTLNDIHMNVDSFYQPPMRRFWMADYIPEGFWPRLICRIATDHQIGKTLRNVIKSDPKLSSTEEATPKYKLNWLPWRSGIAFVDHGRTLLVIKETENEDPPISEDGPMDSQIKHLPGNFRIEIHVYAPDWITLVNECSHEEGAEFDPSSLTAMATQLLIMISKHIETLASDWFPGMLRKLEDYLPPPVHLPCWKCYGNKSCDQPSGTDVKLDGNWAYYDTKPVHCFRLNEGIVPAALDEDLECPIHGKIKIVHTAPDLVFSDLTDTSNYYQDNSVPLRIHGDKVLGKGGYGFVCEGELTPSTHSMLKKKVAVKVFLQDMADLDNFSTVELLERSKQARHLLHAYKEIRQEVAFLSALDHPHLTQLCGVRTSPYMCLLLELAPLGSLRTMLKEYQQSNLVLESLTLKATVLQITKGLEFLHRHQIVHLDMKSPNVLVWYFPSADLKYQDRVRHAGNVWLKLADYGISQVSTGFVMRVRTTPVGTPGYMAPELFDQLGQQVSSEKVDVFAFGMTLYELLSLKPPFNDVMAIKRNNEVREKHRPLLKAKQTRSLVLLQELMRLCWEHDPDERPTMSQIRGWVEAEEFERLRAEVALSDVHSISCAHVCRITPENEEEFASERQQKSNQFRSEEEEDDELQYLPSVLEDSGHVEHTVSIEEEEVCSTEEDIYRFVPSGRQSIQPGFVLDHAYTQIWMCGRDQKKGLLHIFTYFDGQPGFHTFSGYCSKEEVSALCSVRNMIWMGTTTGTLKVFHAPTLKAKFTGKLSIGVQRPSCILDILHIKSLSCVLVSTTAGDIWSFHDGLTTNGLVKQCRLTLMDYQCYHLVAVESHGSVEVWGTLDNSQLCLLEKDGAGWKSQEIKVKTGDPKLRVCSHIALAQFKDKKGAYQSHLWISFRSRGVLVSWDATLRQQRCVVNCNSFQQLKENKDSTFQVSTLEAHGKKVFFGTDDGSVGILDSETNQLLRTLHWYDGKVRTLLVMPKEVECCVCAEVPSPVTMTDTGRTHYPKPPDLFKNPHNITVKDRNAVMVTTFGNGRRKYAVHTVTRSERTKQFDKEFHQSSTSTKKSTLLTHENVSLLSWKS